MPASPAPDHPSTPSGVLPAAQSGATSAGAASAGALGAGGPVRRSLPGNVVRGALIGVVETVPGVSGGTVALVVGIYDELINSAGHVVSAGKRLLLGPDRAAGARHHLARVEWRIVLPVAIGMVAALLTVAGPMSHLVEEHPVTMRALFFGMVLASVGVPLRLAGGALRVRDAAVVAAATVLAFVLVSVPPTTVAPAPLLVVLAAMVAVSALLLPGLSGSFLLLTIGLYQPTLRAVDELDLGYLSLFLLGAALGMVVIVKGLQWLLDRHHRVTMLALTGLMLGALRTLWPWQLEDRTLLAPEGDWWLQLLAAAAGCVVVLVLLAVDARTRARTGHGAQEELAGVESGVEDTDRTR
ncbi:DUF368 domain-containing protein [Kocuria turfanensis]|uniref:DUF368 domain-containing protein n=1 Tax=Kocuria turfanensis TaxID=388357 RepID=A0A512I9B7_9MICC|nr:DUF368 domain-containing protein [Kocuria turfanensis]GEO94298.1 DUF368 domain-containing protein [Kocuria turfanensis]